MANDGYIKLYRKMMKWGWYTDTTTKCVFLHLLFLACYEPCFFKGVHLDQGQAVASIRQISTDTGLSVRSVRTALEHLKTTQEVTQEPFGKFSVFTVNNYSDYQGTDTISDKQPTQERHSTDTDPYIKKLRSKEIPPIPPTGGAAAVDENLKILVNAYQQDIGTLSRTTADMLRSWTEEFDVELIRAAIAEAAMQNKRTLSYVSGILKRCRECGVTTAAEFEAEKQNHGKKEEPVHETRYLNDPRYHS